MRKKSRKTFVAIILLQFLFWTQLVAVQLVCQCDHSPENTSAYVSPETAPSHECCASESEPAAASFESHETTVSSPEDEHHSCCSEQSAEPPHNTNLNYSASSHWCKIACLSVEPVQTKQSLLPKANHKSPDLISVSQPLFNSNFASVPPAPVEPNFLIFSNSPPLFLLNSAFLI